jgi:hypothetical protein
MARSVQELADSDHAHGFARKVGAKPAVLPANTLVTGFNSCPPLHKLFRVARKSAVLSPAVVANSRVFLRSQNRCLAVSGSVIGFTGFTTRHRSNEMFLL